MDITKAISKRSVRAYAHCVNVKAGIACVTDGIWLMTAPIQGRADGTYTVDWRESSVQFPNYERVLPAVTDLIEVRNTTDVIGMLKAATFKEMGIGLVHDKPTNTVCLAYKPTANYFSLHNLALPLKALGKEKLTQVYVSRDGNFIVFQFANEAKVYFQAIDYTGDK